MKKPDNYLESLNFYHDNEFNEILSDKPHNRFDESKKAKLATQKIEPQSNQINIKPKDNQVKTTQILEKKDSFIKPINSTSDAVSNLAKRFNQNNQTDSNANSAFKPLKEIVLQAKNLAAGAKNTHDLKKIVEEFDGCNLKKMATNTVFCDGNPESKIMVIGEAPGNHEDLQGIPFCGDSGKVLDAMFEAINMKRANDYYISNVIFWRPPGNRKPTSEELAICQPFVERHIQLIDPKVIILVGSTAMNAIINRFEPITKVRGQFIDFSPAFLEKTTKAFTIFHPSYLMRQPAKKKIAWQDMLALEQFVKDF